jgi:hypothetical protein
MFTKLGVIWKYLSQWYRWGNLDANLGGYFEFSFIMTKVGNLNTNLGVILNYVS